MKIDKLQTKDFMGLTGAREFTFPEKITAFATHNGVGKTSVLNALRFGITGSYGNGYPVSGGADKCDVGITLSTGTQIIREINKDGNKLWYNRKGISPKELEKAIQAESGMELKVLKTVTASELIGSMKPQDLQALMLQYIPETLDTETVLSYIPVVTEGMKKTAEELLPKEPFGTDALDNFHKTVYGMRTDVNRRKREVEAEIKALGNPQLPAENRKELEDRLEALKKTAAEAAAYKASYDAWTREQQQKADLQKKIAAAKSMLAGYASLAYDATKADALRKDFAIKQAELDETKRLYNSLKSTAGTLKTAIDTLDRPVCPLSEKLKCTTDKTPVRDELQKCLAETEAEAANLLAKTKTIVSEMETLQKSIREMEEARVQTAKKEGLEKQVADFEATLKTLVMNEPKKPDVPDAGADEDVRRKLDAIGRYEKAAVLKKENEELSTRVSDLTALIEAFDKKGFVRSSVTSAYISAFETSCNDVAEKLRPGMRIRFVERDGIVPMLDVNGDGRYYPYQALSGGEKIYLVFLILDMFNQMCGIKMLFLDELSVLDQDNFEALLALLEKAEGYDQIFLTTVDHPGLMAALKKHKISVVETV